MGRHLTQDEADNKNLCNQLYREHQDQAVTPEQKKLLLESRRICAEYVKAISDPSRRRTKLLLVDGRPAKDQPGVLPHDTEYRPAA